MILVTGATGFVGRHLVRRLTDAGLRVRVLLRPGADLSKLPRPLTIETMIGATTDADSLLAALDGVHTIFHLVGTETRGRHAQMTQVDVEGARVLVEASLTARAGRIVYISRLGADRASAFPILRAKGEIEEIIRSSGMGYTIFRPGVLFGKGDRFSEHIAMLASTFPLYPVPGDGETLFQPLWVEDLVTCLLLSLNSLDLIDAVVTLGGPELLSYRRMVMRVMQAVRHSAPIIGLPLLMSRAGVWFLDGLFARWPITEQWIEMLSTTQTADLGVIERQFGFRPTAFDVGVLTGYMKHRHYTAELVRYCLTSKW